MRRRNALIILVILSSIAIFGCNGKTETGSITTPPASTTTSVVDQANLANQSGGFNAVMKLAVEIKTDGSPTWDGVQSVLKTTDTDTMTLRVVKTNIGGGYFRWTVTQKVLASENARGYDMPFTYPIDYIHLVSSSLGAVYNCEPGYPWGDVYDDYGCAGSSHAKLGQTYITWSTCNDEFAVFVFENNQAYWLGTPAFAWKTSGEPCVAVRDPDNGDLPFVLKVK